LLDASSSLAALGSAEAVALRNAIQVSAEKTIDPSMGSSQH
jgi:hypothetical protein